MFACKILSCASCGTICTLSVYQQCVTGRAETGLMQNGHGAFSMITDADKGILDGYANQILVELAVKEAIQQKDASQFP